MWKLKIDCKTKELIGDKEFDTTESIVLKFESLRVAVEYIANTEMYGVGEYKYTLIKEEVGETEC